MTESSMTMDAIGRAGSRAGWAARVMRMRELELELEVANHKFQSRCILTS